MPSVINSCIANIYESSDLESNNMYHRLIHLCCLIMFVDAVLQDEPVSTPPKFGDRIGKLKRNFYSNPTVNLTTVARKISSSTLSFHDKNYIDRSDDFHANNESEEKKVSAIKLEKEKKSTKLDKNMFQKFITTSFDHKQTNASEDNRPFQLQSPSSSLVQARLEMLTDFFDVPPSSMSSVYSTPPRPASLSTTGVVLIAKNQPNNATFKSHHMMLETGLREDPWVIPVLVLSCCSMLMMASFEIFVLCKTRKTSPNRRHLFLGQMLLLGLFSCAGLSALLTVRPTTLSCATIRFGTGVSFSIVFGSLLVKSIFLISLNGGTYQNAVYQGILLLSCCLTQITIGIQWLITAPPGITFYKNVTNRLILTAENLNLMKESNIQLCRTSFSEMRISLLYLDFLIIIVAILAIKSRGIRDNYREASFISLAIALVIPIWLGWTLVGLAVHERYKDACLAFGLLATPSIVFLVMFVPKGRQLSAIGREDLYIEDREERFSASSRAGSGYSPSFFHFKPIKYGVMNGKTSSTGDEINSKHKQAVTTLGGGKLQGST